MLSSPPDSSRLSLDALLVVMVCMRVYACAKVCACVRVSVGVIDFFFDRRDNRQWEDGG